MCDFESSDPCCSEYGYCGNTDEHCTSPGIDYRKGENKSLNYWEFVAGSVIQATGTLEFEDGLLIGHLKKAQNGLQRVCTIPGFQPGAVGTPRFLRGQIEFQSALVRVAA